MVLSDGLTLAKQMETAERLSNAEEGEKVKFLRILKQCIVQIFKLKLVHVSVQP